MNRPLALPFVFAGSIAIAVFVSFCISGSAHARGLQRPYQSARTTLHDLRWTVFGLQDAVSDARHGESDKIKKQAIRQAKRRLQNARDEAARLSSILADQRAKHKQAAEAKAARRAGKEPKPFIEPEIGTYSLAVLENQLKRQNEWLDRAANELDQIAGADQVDPMAIDDRGSDADAETTGDQPVSLAPPEATSPQSNSSPLRVRVEAMADELELARRWAREQYHRDGLYRKLRDAFTRHGATNRHGWVGAWADGIWLHGYGDVGGGHYAPLHEAIRDFRGHLDRTDSPGERERAYTRYLAGVMRIWRRDTQQRYAVMERIIDNRGHIGAAMEADDKATSTRLFALEKPLYEELSRPFPLDVKKFVPWSESVADAERELADEARSSRDGTTIPADRARRLLDDLRPALDAHVLPTVWVDQLLQDPPRIAFDADKLKDHQATGLYVPSDDTIYVDPRVDIDKMSDEDRANLLHEAFHAWYDGVPYWWDLWLSEADEEAVAGFLESRFSGQSLSGGIHRAVAEAGQHAAAPQDAVRAILKVDEFLDGSLLGQGFSNDKDRREFDLLMTDIYKDAQDELAQLQSRTESEKDPQ